MITAKDLNEANARIKTVPIKGKQYAQVNERIQAFRAICPAGSIQTEITALADGIVTMRAVVMDDEEHILATGYAQEKEASSNINKTSYIENCETSAVGRALGFAGIGVDGSMASAEEVANAMLNQDFISEKEQKMLREMVESRGYAVDEIFPGGLKLTSEQYAKAVKQIGTWKAKDDNGQG